MVYDQIRGDTGRMNEDGVRVTRVDWLAAVPSLRLLEAIHLAVSLRVLVPVLVLMLFAKFTMPLWDKTSTELSRANPVQSLLNVPDCGLPEYLDAINESLSLIATGSAWQLTVGIRMLGLWMLMLGFCGVSVLRSAGCRFCTGTGSGVTASVRFSLQSWKAILISAFLSWILLGLLCVAFRTLCWTGARTHSGITAAASLMYIVGCAVLGISWLFSLAAVAIDRCDGAEALSRGICYVLSRWLRVVVYTMVFCLVMVVCNQAVSWLADQSHALASSMYTNPDPLIRDEFRSAARTTLDQFAEMVRLSLFLCEVAVAYVLLRNVEDGVSLREIDGGRSS